MWCLLVERPRSDHWSWFRGIPQRQLACSLNLTSGLVVNGVAIAEEENRGRQEQEPGAEAIGDTDRPTRSSGPAGDRVPRHEKRG